VRLYLDNNVYNRPFDNQRVSRNRTEAQIVLELLEKVEAGEIGLVSSFVLDLEHSLSPLQDRRERVGALIGLAREYVSPEPSILERAKILEEAGLKGIDALHLSVAEHARVDCFVTSDDKLLKAARRTDASVKVASPQELLEEGVI